MSSIFEDGAGNKYLGDCRWGNHDINYPTTNWLKANDYQAFSIDFLNDLGSLATSAGYSSVSNSSAWSNSDLLLFSATPVYGGARAMTLRQEGTRIPYVRYETILNSPANLVASWHSGSFGASSIISENGIGICCWRDSAVSQSPFAFYLMTRLVDVNTELNYYSQSTDRGFVLFHSYNGTNYLTYLHYVTSSKPLLQTGRAAYTIDCSDGQTPGAQWATDMWVYDNNAALGYPVIGRVPNMLLGVGTYTYLKPVKIQGSVFPDNGSPWYLPVGTFSGKTLLMRCYSSMS